MPHESQKPANITAVQGRDHIFSGKDPVSVIVAQRSFKTSCDTCTVYESSAMSVLRRSFIGPAEASMKVPVTILNSANFYQKGPFKSYCAFNVFLWNPHLTDENTTQLDVKLGQL